MFPFVLKKDYQIWHRSCDSHKTTCLFPSRARRGMSFEKQHALIWQFQTVFQFISWKWGQQGTCQVSFLLSHISKDLNKRFHHNSFLKLRFEAGPFTTVQDSEYSGLSSTRTQFCWFRNTILTHPCHSMSLSLQDFNLLMDSNLPLAWMVSMLGGLMSLNVHSKYHENSH